MTGEREKPFQLSVSSIFVAMTMCCVGLTATFVPLPFVPLRDLSVFGPSLIIAAPVFLLVFGRWGWTIAFSSILVVLALTVLLWVFAVAGSQIGVQPAR